MSLFAIPVTLPLRLHQDSSALHTFQIEAVASQASKAIAVAAALAPVACRLHLGAAPRLLHAERALVGPALGNVPGPYCYVFTHGLRVPHLVCAPRLDEAAARDFGLALSGLDPQQIYGCIVDLGPLAGMSSAGLGVLAEHSQRLNFHIFRPPEMVVRALTLVGLHKFMCLHADLPSALAGLLAKARARNALA